MKFTSGFKRHGHWCLAYVSELSFCFSLLLLVFCWFCYFHCNWYYDLIPFLAMDWKIYKVNACRLYWKNENWLENTTIYSTIYKYAVHFVCVCVDSMKANIQMQTIISIKLYTTPYFEIRVKSSAREEKSKIQNNSFLFAFWTTANTVYLLNKASYI